MLCVLPVVGSNRPNSPNPCEVYQTLPSSAGATSCGREPGGMRNSCNIGLEELEDKPTLTCANKDCTDAIVMVTTTTAKITDITNEMPTESCLLFI